MAVITSAQNGNFTDTATWVGGIVPGAGDDAVAAHTVTFDADVTVISFQQSGTGKFLLGNGRTITGNVIANAGTFASGGTVEVTATTTATINGNVTGTSSLASLIASIVFSGTGTLTVNGNVTAGSGTVTLANNHAGIYTNVTNTVNVNGNLSIPNGQNKHCLFSDVSSNTTWNVIGDLPGGLATGNFAIYATGVSPVVSITGNVRAGQGGDAIRLTGDTPTISVTGFVTGLSSTIGINATGNNAVMNITGLVYGAGVGGHGVQFVGNGVVNLVGLCVGGPVGNVNGIISSGTTARVNAIGRVVGGIGGSSHGINLTGANSYVYVNGSVSGESTLSHGVLCSSTSYGVVVEGDLNSSRTGAVPVYARIFRMTATNSGVTRYATSDGSGSLVSRVSPDNATGVPDQSDVRSGTLYGYNNELSGSLTMPPVQAVKYGVPVGNTTGTGEFDLGRAVTVLGEAIASGMTTGSRQ